MYRSIAVSIACLAALASLFWSPAPAFAHDLTDRRVTGTEVACEVKVWRDRLTFDYWIAVGDLAALDFRKRLDLDGSGKIEPSERERIHALLRERICAEGFVLEVDDDHLADRRLVFDRLRSSIRDWEEVGEPNPLKVNLQLHLPLPAAGAARHEIGFYPRNIMDLPAKTRVLVSGADKISIQFVHPDDEEPLKVGIPRGAMEPTGLPFNFEAAADSQNWVMTEEPEQIDTSLEAQLKDLVRRDDLPLGLQILGLVLAFGWGAGHALSPGHGKTLVGAYLIGSRGTIGNALVLGLTVTLAHTFTVFVAGLIMLYFSNALRDSFDFWINLGSGATIVIMGLALLRARMLGISAPFEHAHGPGGHHHHHHGDHAHEHEHDHAHDHAHDHDHAHEHEHEHGEAVGAAPAGVSWRQLIPLGISGGALPCPSAVVILLYSVHYRKILWGLAVLLCFSLGLAAVLVAIGILLVTGSSWLKRRSGGGALLRVAPAISALIVTVVGILLCVNTWRAREFVQSQGPGTATEQPK